jgi:hypothetical protein
VFGSADAPLRFLLERVQDVYGLRKADRIHCPPCIAIVVRDNLNHSATAKPFQRLGGRVNSALLRRIEGLADIAPHLARKVP